MKKPMTEELWLKSKLVRPMRDFLCNEPGLIYKARVHQHPRGRRRLRLFGIAVARRVLSLVSNPVLHQLLDAAEAFADGIGSIDDLQKLRTKAAAGGYSGIPENAKRDHCQNLLSWHTREEYAAQAISIRSSHDAVSAASFHENAALALEGENLREEIARQAALFRDVFGNPFRKVEFDKSWRTSTAVALAQTMYDSREFSGMPILADALQDAGCDNEDVLTHCRDTTLISGEPPAGSPGPPPVFHVRGCWVVDLVLDKS